jgi:hypothetical protein
MMINCKESAIRSSELWDRRIKGIRKLELWYHLLICRFCRLYDKQIRFLGKLSGLIGEASEQPPSACDKASGDGLSEDTKARIKEKLSAG